MVYDLNDRTMMGIQTTQKELFSYEVDLERRVRRDNPLRAIRERVDFAWVRAEVAHYYGHNGNESVDPEVILKLLFLLFLDNVKSERELMRIVPERLDYLWFLGFGLDDEIPDHSVLSKARARWGRETFERFFVRTVAQCVKLGLVDGTKIHVDSSLVRADAAYDSFTQSSPELASALRAAFAVEESKFEVDREVQLYKPKHRVSFSRTDPDATLASKHGGGVFTMAEPRYKSHRAVDDRCGVITAVEITPGHIFDGACAVALAEQHHRVTGTGAETVVADRHYGTRENIRALQALGIRTHLQITRSKGLAARKGIFHANDFKYDFATDTYRCPANQTLTRRGHDSLRQLTRFTADTNVCRSCPLRAQCTTAATGPKSIEHPDGYELLIKGWAQAKSAEAKRDLRRRMTLIEGSFGQATLSHHFKRARWRRLWRQRIQDHLIAAVQNVKKLIAHGPRATSSAAGCLPEPPKPASNGGLGLRDVFVWLENVFRRFLSELMPYFC